MSGQIDEQWREYFKERLEHMDNSMDKIVNLMEEHQKKDEGFYTDTAELKLQQQMAWRFIKAVSTVAGALGLDKLYHLIKP